MIKELSILIPVYNDYAVPLVRALHSQAMRISELAYEIIVFDDGSTDSSVVERNKEIDSIPNCKYLIKKHHDCRASMRNDLCRQGQYEWHLMLDASLHIKKDDFLLQYLSCNVSVGEVACGGIMVDGGENASRHFRENLRFKYETVQSRNRQLPQRKANPYKSFRTSNFFYHKSVLLRIPYDERIKRYGYEDVMLGKCFEKNKVRVEHIDNPVYYTFFETNKRYLNKVQEAMYTLSQFKSELEDYSPLLQTKKKLERFHLLGFVKLFHKLFGSIILANLQSRRPCLSLFPLYKLGFFCSIT